MKIISIGRNSDCDIVIPDNMISRRHAIIRIYPTGKYELVSLGANGTKVNGNQIVPNQPYPLKRGDSVTFAHVANLDWKNVPDPFKPYKLGALGLLALIVIILALIFIVPQFNHNGKGVGFQNEDTLDTGTGSSEVIQPIDTNPIVPGKKEVNPSQIPDFKFKTPKPKKEKDKDNGKGSKEKKIEGNDTKDPKANQNPNNNSSEEDSSDNIPAIF